MFHIGLKLTLFVEILDSHFINKVENEVPRLGKII